jgi:epoxyqueuosine reductase
MSEHLVAWAPSLEELKKIGKNAGLDDLAVTGVEPIVEARLAIEERKARGLHAGMTFTYGNADRATDPSQLFEGARSVLVGIRRYQPPSAMTQRMRRASPKQREGATGAVAAYVSSDEYGLLREGLEAIAAHLEASGAQAEVVMDDNRLADRAVANRSGLGWLGRNTMLIHPQLGSWTVIGSVVTDALIQEDSPRVVDECGACNRCSVECPTGAINNFGVLDANRCLAWLLQAKGIFPRDHRIALGNHLYGCDDCQVVCPKNDEPQPVAITAPQRESDVDLVELLDSSDEKLMATYGHWYIPRRRPEYLRRNALVVLGNVGSSSDPEVERVIEASLDSSSPLVRSHAIWAACRLGKTELVENRLNDSLLRDDPDGWVASELAAWEISPALDIP